MRPYGIRTLAVPLLLLAMTGAARAADLCAALAIPPELGLSCTASTDPQPSATPQPIATVRPDSSIFAAFTGLTVRGVPASEDTSDQAAWLRRQVTYDLSGVGKWFGDLANDPDMPAPDTSLRRSLEDTGLMIGTLGDLPLSGCGTPDLGTVRADLTCKWSTAGVQLQMLVRLVGAGDRRYAIRAWSMNERRFDQLTALANGFDPAKAR